MNKVQQVIFNVTKNKFYRRGWERGPITVWEDKYRGASKYINSDILDSLIDEIQRQFPDDIIEVQKFEIINKRIE